MNRKISIAHDTYYVGVNDRSKSLFENLWPLPHGVSYNSFLIVDQKVALIDTVDLCYFELFHKKIKQVIGDRPIDYLIINHMEPDHSGSIRSIRQCYPNIEIIGNAKTLSMIEGFFQLTDQLVEIKNGEKLNLGLHELTFHLTPMIHWPETMMTFDEHTHSLFSGDAFGCYGALDGAVIDHQMNTDHFFGEMRRYYSNIVGKYGSPVQKALQKLSTLQIDRLCSTHGPVWESQKEKAIALYDQWSRDETEPGVVIAYGSMYGYTEEMAEVIAQELARCGVRNIVMHNVSFTHASFILSDIYRYKGLIIGSPTYNGYLFPEIDSLLTKILNREIKNHYVACFGSFTWASAAVKRLDEFAEKCHFEVISESVEMKQSMNELTYEKCTALAQKMAKMVLE